MNETYLIESLKLMTTPSLLIAGDYGTGKTNMQLQIIKELVKTYSPAEANLLLIAPRSTFEILQEIPHLVCPVLHSRRMAIHVLNFLMEERIKGEGKAPRLFVVFDEIESFMGSCYSEDLENLLDKANHPDAQTTIIISTSHLNDLILSDKLLETIKLRACFKTALSKQSKLVLDVDEATKINRGEMILFVNGDLIKRECPLLDKDELLGITSSSNFIQSYNSKVVRLFLKPLDRRIKIVADEKLEDAIAVVKMHRLASASFLQRKMGIGYNRAANLIQLMEDKGLIGPARGVKPRKIHLP